MKKSKVEINAKRAERFRKILSDSGMNQRDFAEQADISQQLISKIINQKTGLTEGTAQRVVSAFPEKNYRIEWLMGYDDHQTYADLSVNQLSAAQEESSIMTAALFSLARLNGFQISANTPTGIIDVEEYIRSLKSGTVFAKDGKTVTFSLEELNEFENEICDYVEFRLSHMMK